MTAPPDDTTTDLHAVIAGLRAERDAALTEKALLAEELAAHTAELLERKSEFDERNEYEAATVSVLKAMSASPSDTLPVFNLITRRAAELCESSTAIYELREGQLNYMAGHGMMDLETVAAFRQSFPRPLDRSLVVGRAILERRIVHVRDVAADHALSQATRDLGGTAVVGIPLLRDGEPIGAIALNGRQPGGFSESQIALLQTFAEQAVIAITSAETYRELQTRTTDLQQSLEYQTATSDVLKVISRSTFDLQPVLTMVGETAARLCAADQAVIIRHENGIIEMVANYGFPPEYEAVLKKLGPHRLVADAPMVAYRAIAERRVVHIHDVAAVSGYAIEPIKLGQQRTSLGVPLLRAGEPIGSILLARRRVEPFTDQQIELVNTFADQAVIAIENTRLLTEQQEALEQQTATAEVLAVINASPGNLAPVFDALLERAMRLCEAAFGSLYTFDGQRFRSAAQRGVPAAYAAFRERHPPELVSGAGLEQAVRTRRAVQITDMMAERPYLDGNPNVRAMVELGGMRTGVVVPLCKDEAVLGVISIYRQEVRVFTDKEIALLENFAVQAVIAMENARLLTEQQEALEQQTATAEVLQIINSSPGNLAPVFDAILEKAHALCGAATGSLQLYDGEFFRAVATRGLPDEFANILRQPHRSGLLDALLRDVPFIQITDIADPALTGGDKTLAVAHDIAGVRTYLRLPLRKDDALLGVIIAGRREVRPFSQKEISLLQSFAAQAVIAMENARLLEEIRQRQAELRVTFDNMADGVAMFDGKFRLAAWNRNFQELLDIPAAVLAECPTYAEYLRILAERGEFGTEDIEAELGRRLEHTDRELRLERARPNGQVIEVRRNAVPDGGFVLIYSDITERKRSEAEIRAARDAAETALRELKTAQANLIQAEKMASLGQLTAGIAHEIKNPLNFVNNFAALSVDLLGELKDAIAPAEPALTEKQRAEVEEVSVMLTSNLEKITEHGKRADSIVKAMLEHSRGSSGERRTVDLNALIDEALNLAYHGARAQDQSFNIKLERDFGVDIAPIEVNPQDMTRVFLNIFSNGFYAATQRARNGGDAGFAPTLKVTTRDTGDAVEIRMRDNGTGIPADIKDRLFEPFFSTKPTGQGTGLGLSITYDIVTQQHGGTIAADSNVGEYSEFTIRLPRNP